MCGRFTRIYTWRELFELYQLTNVPLNIQPRYNICPTTEIDVVVRGDDARAVIPMRWGLVPGWWSKPLKEMRLATFNARAETVAEKSMFRDSFKKHLCARCLAVFCEKGEQSCAEFLVKRARRIDGAKPHLQLSLGPSAVAFFRSLKVRLSANAFVSNKLGWSKTPPTTLVLVCVPRARVGEASL